MPSTGVVSNGACVMSDSNRTTVLVTTVPGPASVDVVLASDCVGVLEDDCTCVSVTITVLTSSSLIIVGDRAIDVVDGAIDDEVGVTGTTMISITIHVL